MEQTVLVPHPGWKNEKAFGNQACTICMETVPESDTHTLMFDCPCTLVMHVVCGVKAYWKMGRPTTCLVCKAPASLLLVGRTRTIASENAPLTAADLVVECEFAEDAPNVEQSDEEEAAAQAAEAAELADAVEPVSHRLESSDSESDSDDDFSAGSSSSSKSSTEEETAKAGSSDEESEAKSTASESEEEAPPGDTDSDDTDVVIPCKRKRH